MMLYKKCPRCDGDMSVDRDIWGWYTLCIQCGYLLDMAMKRPRDVKPALGAAKETEPLAS